MSEYQYNPKLKGSKVIPCLLQHGRCPMKCKNCFYQPNEETGESRAYLGPHYEHTPNIPSKEQAKGMIVRFNDVHDSNCPSEDGTCTVKDIINFGNQYVDKFYNTSINKNLERFVYPVVLTVNRKENINYFSNFKYKKVPKNLMFVRARVNSWNLETIDQIINHYSELNIPIMLTYMAYYETPILEGHQKYYSYRSRTTNSYWVINPEEWNRIFDRYSNNKLVRTCGKDANKFSCTECRNCENLYRVKIEELGLPTEVDWT